MGNKKYLIDTNVAIEYLGETLPEEGLVFLDSVVDNEYYFSVINKMELLGFPDINSEEELKFLEMINMANVINLDDEIINKTIEIRKNYRTKLPDAIIAATSLIYNLTLISRNVKDFEKITGIELINPHNF